MPQWVGPPSFHEEKQQIQDAHWATLQSASAFQQVEQLEAQGPNGILLVCVYLKDILQVILLPFWTLC